MRSLRFVIVALLLLLMLARPSLAATYRQPITVSFGAALTGQAANIVVSVQDKTGATITPTVTAATELVAGSGSYSAAITNLDTASLPVTVIWTITGQAGVAASAVLGSDRAADTADGYTAARGALLSNLDATVSSRAPEAGGAVAAIKAQTDQFAFTAGRVNSIVGAYAAGQDPATLLLATTIDGSLTFKQIQTVLTAYQTGKVSNSYNAGTRTQTTIYYRNDNSTPIVTLTSVFDAAGRTTSRTVTYSNLP